MITVELPPFKLPLRVVNSSSSKAILRSNFITGKNPCSIASHVIRKRVKFVVRTVTQDKRDEMVVELPKEKDEEDRSVSSDPSEELTPLSSSPLAILGEGFGNKLMTRGINAAIVLAAGAFATTKLLTVDHDYWQGWTLYEILRYAPEHNWIAYEETLKTNPVFAKMVISGVVYTLGDWIAQCCEGKPLFEFDRNRLLRSGLVGFTFHGSLSHYYYQFCEALFPFQSWWVVPAKIALDQTLWTAIWNSIYYSLLGLLRSESPTVIFQELKETFLPMLTAGWKLWPFAHVITYGVVPVEQRLLWVDCVELIWVTILSTYSNAKSEARISEASADSDSSST